ncbi:MAG: pyrimidine 5'-nucleotidase [Treponemataceae bacterium]|nr:MAG: pyrimidine 5'-nucleotidase [Treponemataceae bacterium]
MIKHLLFDLDNTLYSSSLPMENEVTRRMVQFAADFLNVSFEKAYEMRFGKDARYSTTLEWLMSEYGLSDTEEFFCRVHPESELSELVFDPELRPFLRSLNMPMTILTNAPRIHADRVLRFLKIDDLFLNVIDVETNNLKGKPYADAFMNALSASGFSVDETLFFDDYPSYLMGFQNLGGKTVLVGQNAPPPGLNCFHIKSIYETPRILRECGIAG